MTRSMITNTLSGGAVMIPSRILMTGSRNWTNALISSIALQASLTLLNASASTSVLVHGAARGADSLLADEARKLGMTAEAHPARWNEHTETCPPWDRQNSTCKLAGFNRNAAMIQSGAQLCLAFPTHGYELASGEDRKETSRGTWNCAEEAKNAGIPTLIVWGSDLYPFGDQALHLLWCDAQRKDMSLGSDGQLSIRNALVPF